MASVEEEQASEEPIAENEEEEEEEEDEEEEPEEEDEEEGENDDNEIREGESVGHVPDDERNKLQKLVRRLSSGDRVAIRVHDIVIKGNRKTRDSLIEAEVLDILKNASTVPELLQAAAIANVRLRRLDIFDSVSITLDAGPPELPGTANVIIKVRETKNPLAADVGFYSKPEARSWSIEGSLKYKNLLGYGDIWEGSGAYWWDQTSEISFGVSLPRFKGISTPLAARVSLFSQDWLKFSSYKESLLGLSVGLLSTRQHDLAYNLTWRTLIDPLRMASRAVRRQLGHGLFSSFKYTYKIDRRDSPLRPMRGYAFSSTSQLGGLWPNTRNTRFLRQDFALRCALPLGFWNAAINLGFSGGVVLPWGERSMNLPSPISERFFIGGHSSLVCGLSGITSVLGFGPRGLGPTGPRRVSIMNQSNREEVVSPGRDVLGGDLAATAFADLSFDLPLKWLRESGVHGHVFFSSGNLVKLTENEIQGFTFRKFRESVRSSAGAGIVVPTKFVRLEVNYCWILKQLEHDRGKTGIQFCFSSPL